MTERMSNLKKMDYCDLVERVKETFMEIDSDIIIDLKKQDKEYANMCYELGEMEKNILLFRK